MSSTAETLEDIVAALGDVVPQPVAETVATVDRIEGQSNEPTNEAQESDAYQENRENCDQNAQEEQAEEEDDDGTLSFRANSSWSLFAWMMDVFLL